MLRPIMMALGLLLAVLESSWSNPTLSDRIEDMETLLASGNYMRVLEVGKTRIDKARNSENLQETIDLLIAMGMASQALGAFPDAEHHLQEARSLTARTATLQDDIHAALAWGDYLLASNQVDESVQVLQAGISLARKERPSPWLAALLNNLGNGLLVQRSWALAEQSFQDALQLARQNGDDILEGKILINRVHGAIKQRDKVKASQRLDEALQKVPNQTATHSQAYALISLGKLAADTAQQKIRHHPPMSLVAFDLFQKAAKVARDLKDWKTLSYALGYQGKLYEQERRWADADLLTREAIFHAKSTGSPEILYLWEWQRGRLAKEQGQFLEAQTWYRQAVKTLSLVRLDFHLGLRDGQDAFRELIGPVYYQLTDLLLRQSAQESDPKRQETLLLEARNTIESLKTAELQNLFQDGCVAAAQEKKTTLEQIQQQTVIYYPIPLPDRLEILLTLPTGMKQIVVPVSSAALEEEVHEFRSQLEEMDGTEYLPHAQTLYRWLVAPVYESLEKAGIETIVVVPDGALRTIPLAALHDGQHFLAEKFAVAVTPSMFLTAPRPLDRNRISMLINALSKGGEGFSELPNVLKEVDQVSTIFPGRSLVDEAFTVQEAVGAIRADPYSIVHIASHGQFDHNPEKTFILAYNDKITLNRLQEMIGHKAFRNQPVELLTLSACQTAVGDDRAALGLAGIAIKAGARSALASLWLVDDSATAKLVTGFYRNIGTGHQSKAMALRKIQMQMIHDSATEHPGLWAAFILIGNWL
ncbi:MAG: CHAT domain-containing protein [Magnetococcales bacterium]|nr:CHAT domain-containing protein [Magnetococcales bacterium]